uniref:Uncharacterized protein n=1 Tax=Anguilla anguilla TaxID=7936 RepID=A0A0E9QBV2_ANGAN
MLLTPIFPKLCMRGCIHLPITVNEGWFAASQIVNANPTVNDSKMALVP